MGNRIVCKLALAWSWCFVRRLPEMHLTYLFVCEMKRQDHTKSRWQDGQLEFLEASQKQGAFTCVALGYVAALEAVKDWIKKAS